MTWYIHGNRAHFKESYYHGTFKKITLLFFFLQDSFRNYYYLWFIIISSSILIIICDPGPQNQS